MRVGQGLEPKNFICKRNFLLRIEERRLEFGSVVLFVAVQSGDIVIAPEVLAVAVVASWQFASEFERLLLGRDMPILLSKNALRIVEVTKELGIGAHNFPFLYNVQVSIVSLLMLIQVIVRMVLLLFNWWNEETPSAWGRVSRKVHWSCELPNEVSALLKA